MSTTLPAGGKMQPDSSEATSVGTGEAETDLRKEALASLRRKRKLGENVVAYITVNGVLWLIWAFTDRSTDGTLPWPAWVSLIWGFLLAMDAWRAFGPWPRGLARPITEADIQRELQRFRRS
jgi:hypothetical protein